MEVTAEHREIRKILNKENKQKRREEKVARREFEQQSTYRLPIPKGQWQYGAVGMSISDGNQHPFIVGNIPYLFYRAARSHTKFAKNFEAACEALGGEVKFGVMVGGIPVEPDESGKLVQQRKKPTRKFHVRENKVSHYTQRLNVSVQDNVGFEDEIEEGLAFGPGKEVYLKRGTGGNIIVDNETEDHDVRVVVKGRAKAYCLNRYIKGAKSLCFGLIPYSKIESCEDPELFEQNYDDAFNRLGKRLGKVSYGWIVERTRLASGSVESFAVISKNQDGRWVMKFFDFKSPMDSKLKSFLEGMIDFKKNSWKRSFKSKNGIKEI